MLQLCQACQDGLLANIRESNPNTPIRTPLSGNDLDLGNGPNTPLRALGMANFLADLEGFRLRHGCG
jgi:hypothetical protein